MSLNLIGTTLRFPNSIPNTSFRMDLASLIKPKKKKRKEKESMSITYDNNHYKSKSFIAQLVNIYMCFKKIIQV